MPEAKPTTPTIHFSGVGTSVQINFDIKHLSNRDKVQLCRSMMEMLGITDALIAEPDETRRAQEIITRCWDKMWDTPNA